MKQPRVLAALLSGAVAADPLGEETAIETQIQVSQPELLVQAVDREIKVALVVMMVAMVNMGLSWLRSTHDVRFDI